MEDDLMVLDCPTCGTEEHRVLRATDQNMTVQCMECSRVRSVTPKRERIVELNLVVSKEESSFRTHIPTPSDEMIRVGYEFELDEHRMIVTAIEVDGQQSPVGAKAHEIKTLFAKVFDTVPLKLSINEGEITKSYRVDVDPDMEVPVGLILALDGRLLVIKTLKSDQNRTLHKGFLFARNVRRAFCDAAPPRAKPGQVITDVRRRGAPLARKGEAPKKRLKGPRGQKSRAPRAPKRS